MKFFLQLICLIVPSAAMKTDMSRTIPVDGAKQGMERILLNNAVHDLDEAKEMPDPEKNDDMEGMGGLGGNLEFMMLKLAQLETIVELQQLQIKEMNEWRHGHMAGEHNASKPPPSALEVKLASEAKAQHAQDTLKGVLRKHHRQRETREFATRPKAAPAPPQAPEATAQLIQRSRSNHSKERAEEQSLDASVNSKVLGVLTSGTGLIGDALGDAYEKAKDPVAFVSETVIDTVDMAMDSTPPRHLKSRLNFTPFLAEWAHVSSEKKISKVLG